MDLIRGYHNLHSGHQGCVLTIGNFDGVHLGHQAIIAQLVKIAQGLDLPAMLITFEPQPQEFFATHNAPARLTGFREKLCALRYTALDRLLCLRFDHSLAGLSAGDFIEHLLVRRLGVKSVVIGDDFRFGRHGRGDLTLLKEAGKRYAFEVVNRDAYLVQGARASSSWIRDALANGELDAASTLLGRPYSLYGRVAQGEQLGRTIGFPTANIPLRRLVSPLSGVYVAQVVGLAEKPLPGVANVGTRPSVGGADRRLEVYIFDFDGDIYGRHIQVEFLRKIRDEQRFDSIEALKCRISQDAHQARAFFAATKSLGIPSG